MATLENKTIASTYTSLLKLEGDAGSTVAGASGDAVQVKTGNNDATILYLNTDRVGINRTDPTTTLSVQSTSAGALAVAINIRNSSSSNNTATAMDWEALDTGGINTTTIGRIRCTLHDNSAGAEKSSMTFYTQDGAGGINERMTINEDGFRFLSDKTNGLTTVGSVLTLGTLEPSVVANDVLGRINFYAPSADAGGDGGDQNLVGASIVAMASETFSTVKNSTCLHFQTGTTATATTNMTIDEDGFIGMGGFAGNPSYGLDVAYGSNVDGEYVARFANSASGNDADILNLHFYQEHVSLGLTHS